MESNAVKAPSPQVVQMIAAAMLGSVGVYAVMGIALVHLGILKPIVEPDLAMKLGILLGAMGSLSAFSALLLRGMMTARSGRTLADKLRITIVCMAVADSSGVLGLVHAILAGNLGASFILWGASIGVGILLFPTRAWLGEGLDDRTHFSK